MKSFGKKNHRTVITDQFKTCIERSENIDFACALHVRFGAYQSSFPVRKTLLKQKTGIRKMMCRLLMFNRYKHGFTLQSLLHKIF